MKPASTQRYFAGTIRGAAFLEHRLTQALKVGRLRPEEMMILPCFRALGADPAVPRGTHYQLRDREIHP